VTGRLSVGEVELEIGFPRDGQGTIILGQAARPWRGLRTYVGSWSSRFRITKGKAGIARFEDKAARTVRSFCVALRTR